MDARFWKGGVGCGRLWDGGEECLLAGQDRTGQGRAGPVGSLGLSGLLLRGTGPDSRGRAVMREAQMEGDRDVIALWKHVSPLEGGGAAGGGRGGDETAKWSQTWSGRCRASRLALDENTPCESCHQSGRRTA